MTREPGYRILVTGSRYATEKHRAAIAEAIHVQPWFLYEPVTVVHGGARGVDSLADDIANWKPDFQTERHSANWNRWGKNAGPLRNQEMVDLGADVCLAFKMKGVPNAGTTDCSRRAQVAGIPVKEFWLEP